MSAAGCAELATADQQRMQLLQQSLAVVTAAGADVCAPRELALARANYEFAAVELRQGDAQRAAEHLDEAEENVGAAQVRSPKQRCADGVVDLTSQPVEPSARDSDGDGIPDARDACPNQPEDRDGYLDADGCADPDNDKDGIPDAQDACPNEAEDRDGFQDQDGCPDPDNDSDGVPDAHDACPDSSGPAADNGCPNKEYPNLTLTAHDVRLGAPIVFNPGSAIIRSVSYPLLDTIVALLRDRPTITLEIGGHTDSRGDDARNLALSQQQADAVRDYLVAHGVNAARLTARGYGETRPIESNSTSRGRSINRRIELVRTDRAP